MCRLMLHAELVSRVEMGHIQGYGVSCLTEASSSSSVVTGEGLGRQAEPSCSVSPALQSYSALTELREEVYGSSPNLTLTAVCLHRCSLSPTTSPSILSSDLDSRGVRYKGRWMESSFL